MSSINSTLLEYIKAGIALQPKIYSEEIGCYVFIKRIYNNPEKWICTGEALDWWLEHGIHNYSFIPSHYGFVCVDIDIKKPWNGLGKFYSYFPSRQAGEEHIASHPCHVHTPSGGLHLYYVYTGTEQFKADLGDGVEVKHGDRGITAAGSRKGMAPYVMIGSLDKAPPLLDYPVLYWAFKKPKFKPVHYPAMYKPDMEYMSRDMTGTHHNNMLKFAGRCIRAGVDEASCINWACQNPLDFGENKEECTYQIGNMYKRYGR